MSYNIKSLPDKYDPTEAEARWQNAWYASRVYSWEPEFDRENTFVIDTPPPTVSGLLHMGHVFSYTQADFVARYQRMRGKTVFYSMGFDDNGLPTERLVEKVKKIQAHRYIQEHGREGFIELCKEVSEEARNDFRTLFKSIALSVDWEQEYHTISEQVRKLSQLSFLDMMEKGEVYRALKPMLWDPVDQTAIAQAEVVDKEMDSHFNDILFGIEGSDETITIGTTRPEMIPACVAIFYHPEDERYRHLKGKHAITPLFGVKVPILEDEAVEPEKGTGIMMCCTFGDEEDVKKWEKHKLNMVLVLNKFGKFESFEQLTGTISSIGDRDTFARIAEAVAGKKASNKDKNHPGAREIILEELDKAGLLLKSEPIKHMVKCAERSGAPLEILPTHQWFVKVLDKKEALKEKAAECNWHPEWMKVRMDQWIDGLNWDWCISRQRYFGVPFPVWYSKRAGEEGKVILADPEQLPVNPLVDEPIGYGGEEVTPEADVMDTWATSSISPQINSHAITRKYAVEYARHQQLFPADLRPQAHEIIRTWAFYTIVKAHIHEGTIPWKNLMISGWCLAEDKTKMSKSKGNFVTPVELIQEAGTDAVRYWASTSKLGADTAFSRDALKIGKKLVNKLWNATKFASIHLNKLPDTPRSAAEDVAGGPITETLDKWILSRMHTACKKATNAFEEFEYANARAAAEDWFWNDFCDQYLELVKARAYDEAGENPAGQQSAVYTIYHCLDGILRLFAPFVPHITEELFSHLFPADYEQAGSLHARGMWAKDSDYRYDAEAEKAGDAAVEVLNAIRKAKSEKGVSIKFPIERIEIGAGKGEEKGSWALLEGVVEDVKTAGNVAELTWKEGASGLESEHGAYALDITFAKQSEVA